MKKKKYSRKKTERYFNDEKNKNSVKDKYVNKRKKKIYKAKKKKK